jgi:hypothetical protein
MATRIERRLTTILCADVAGYSGHMECDEDGTLLRLREYRSRLTRPVEHHRGRIANASGDGVVAEFPSAIDAVRAGIDVQRELGSAILISGPVHDLVRSKLAIAYEFLGPQQVKNITSEILVHRIRLGDGHAHVPAAGLVRVPAWRLSCWADWGSSPASSMGIVANLVLWLGLSHASLALLWPRRQRIAVLCVLLVGFLAGINFGWPENSSRRTCS